MILIIVEMPGVLSLLCFSKGKRLELGFKMRVVWSERDLGLGVGMGVTMGQPCGLLSRQQCREVIQVMESLLLPKNQDVQRGPSSPALRKTLW